MQQLAPCPSQPPRPIPYGLVSLSDMINFSLAQLLRALVEIRAAISSASARDPNALLSSAELEVFRKALEDLIKPPLDALEISQHRVFLLSEMAKNGTTNVMLVHELIALDTDIAGAALLEQFYHYPLDHARMLLIVDHEWAPTIASFPDAEEDIRAGVDCYALERYTACVFHMMRVAEHGLRALAIERNIKLDKPLTYASWQEIIGPLQGRAKEILNRPPSDERELALAFYNCAIADISALKDRYRNRVMHARETFNIHESADAMLRTRALMNGIAPYLRSNASPQVPWTF